MEFRSARYFYVVVPLGGGDVESVVARGKSYLQEDVVFLSLYFKDKKMAQIQIFWLDPQKERKIIIVGSKKMLVFDDMQSSEKIKIYNKEIDRRDRDKFDSYGDYLTLRSGDILLPYVKMVAMSSNSIIVSFPKKYILHALIRKIWLNVFKRIKVVFFNEGDIKKLTSGLREIDRMDVGILWVIKFAKI